MIHLFHRWRSVNAKHMQQWFESPLTRYKTEPEDITEVLQRCEHPRCNQVRTTTLQGVWSLDELTRPAPRR